MAMMRKKFINIDTKCHSHYNFFSLSLMVDRGTSTCPGSANAKLLVVLAKFSTLSVTAWDKQVLQLAYLKTWPNFFPVSFRTHRLVTYS